MTEYLNILFLFVALISLLDNLLTNIYWWQIKEYRVDRFLEHLKTNIGQKLIFNTVSYLKILTLITLLINTEFSIYLAFAFYLFPFLKAIKNLAIINKIRRTFRAVSIILIFLGAVGFFLYFNINNILATTVLLDLLVPITSLGAVLISGIFFGLLKKLLIFRATQKIASLPKLKIIGITGSFGKTSTKEYINQILSTNFRVLSTPGRVNTDIGIAQFILKNLKNSDEILIIEMGAYRIGEVERICQMVKPTLGVITAIENQHLALFGSLENIVKAKFELLNYLGKNGTAILNWDSKNIVKNQNQIKSKIIWYSTLDKKDIYSENVQIEATGLKFDINLGNKKYNISTNLIGKQNISNLLAAILVAREFGIKIDQIIDSLKHLKSVPGNMELSISKNGAKLLNDSYNINPQGAILSIETLDVFKDKTKVVILSPMLELGYQTKESHFQVLEKAVEVCDYILWVGVDFIEMIEEFKKSNTKGYKISLYKDYLGAVGDIKNFDKSDVAILFEGRNSANLFGELTK